jgi:hypothetical protein
MSSSPIVEASTRKLTSTTAIPIEPATSALAVANIATSRLGIARSLVGRAGLFRISGRRRHRLEVGWDRPEKFAAYPVGRHSDQPEKQQSQHQFRSIARLSDER